MTSSSPPPFVSSVHTDVDGYEHPAWGELYDVVYRDYDADLSFYLAQGEASDGAVLELACGTGRITLPLAARGVDVSGLDRSPVLLERLREKCRERGVALPLFLGDMRCFGIDRRFATILIPFRAFIHLTDQGAQVDALARAWAHLVDGGRLVFNVFMPDHGYMARTDGLPHLRKTVSHDAGTVLWTSISRYDTVSQVTRTSNIFDCYGVDGELERRVRVPQVIRWVSPAELRLMLATAGFRDVRMWGDFEGGPLRAGCPEIVVEAVR